MTRAKNVKKEKPKKKCNDCKKELSVSSFYQSSSIMFDGYTPMCKKCIKKKINYDDINTIYSVLQSLDIPFVKDLWEKCENKKIEKEKIGRKYDVFGNYVRQINSLPQWQCSGWKNSDFEKSKQIIEDESNIKKEITLEHKRQLKETWGDEWSLKELILLDKTYRELSADKNLKYNSSKQYLKLATIYYVRSLMAAKAGNTNDAKNYTSMFNDTMKMGEFNPSALAKNSNLEKLGSFADFSLMVEECVDVLNIRKILPEYFETPRDKADKVIWYNINYMQDCLGMKRSSYDEIYDFYIEMEANALGITKEEMKKQYIKSSTINDFLESEYNGV